MMECQRADASERALVLNAGGFVGVGMTEVRDEAGVQTRRGQNEEPGVKARRAGGRRRSRMGGGEGGEAGRRSESSARPVDGCRHAGCDQSALSVQDFLRFHG